MKTKEEHINYWIKSSNDDWEAVEFLLKGKKNLQALFFAHLVIEKLCKAVWIKHNSTNVPPKIHNLNYLLSQTPLKLSETDNELLLNLNRFQLEGRYPEYISKINEICTDEFTSDLLNQTNNLKSWLIKQLQ
jgi:HEPN domain-containing protein